MVIDCWLYFEFHLSFYLVPIFEAKESSYSSYVIWTFDI